MPDEYVSMSERYPRRLAVGGVLVFLLGTLLLMDKDTQPPVSSSPVDQPPALTYEEKKAALQELGADSGQTTLTLEERAAELRALSATAAESSAVGYEEKIGSLQAI